jgi:hypothetical protein
VANKKSGPIRKSEDEDRKQKSDDAVRTHLREAWKVSEDVAMHFNNLLVGFRLKAMGGIAIGAVTAIGLNIGHLENPRFVAGVFVVLTMIWVLVWALDFFYYYRLLIGAVDELLRLEKKLGDISLSHSIECRVHGKERPHGDIQTEIPSSPEYPSVVSHAVWNLSNAACARRYFSRIDSAFACQVNRLGLSLCASM